MSDFIQYLHDWLWTYIWQHLPTMPFGSWMADLVYWLRDNWQGLFGTLQTGFETTYEGLADALLWLPSGVMVIIFALIAWLARSWKLGLAMGAGAFLIAWTPFWASAMDTLAMVIVSTIIATLIAIPLGIWTSESPTLSKMARPVLDFMQTLPAFVYLIPVVMLFEVGPVPGIIATIIFCMPPGVRFTELGLRQVDKETVEAGQAFGASPLTILTRIKIPLALPTIMAGLNQVIMLSLSMVVIAGLVGGGGLGQEIDKALGNLDLAAGFNAGLGVAFLAIFLDRVTQGISDRTPVARAARIANG
ncbi:ABC transporter permease [Salininema proteolyticum]|uniref:ABC transporter permease n=1 Tax=Salininema proteolyticum TaxID=1607685 RepID=A0ABV8U0Q2_9ACTN